jgi:hypothetical protein
MFIALLKQNFCTPEECHVQSEHVAPKGAKLRVDGSGYKHFAPPEQRTTASGAKEQNAP